MDLLRIACCAVILVVALAGECIPEAKVGSCLVTGCFADLHGPAQCHTPDCLCDPGYCSEDQYYCKKIQSNGSCDVKEYMKQGEFVNAVAACVADKCSSSFWENSVRACCSLQCTANTVQVGLPHCWHNLAPLFHKQAKAFGVTAKYSCQLDRVSATLALSEKDVQRPQVEEYIKATVTEFALEKDATSGTRGYAAGGTLFAGMVAYALYVRARTNGVVQPPLLA